MTKLDGIAARIRLAYHAHRGRLAPEGWGDLPDGRREKWRVVARAAIEAITYPTGPDGCNGVSSRWCPNCGTCACPRSDGGTEPMDSPSCPLHSEASAHATPTSPGSAA